MSKRYLIKFDFGCRDAHCGSLEVWSQEDKELVDAYCGSEVYFGEIAGKHSEVYGLLDANDYHVISTDSSFIVTFLDAIGSTYGATNLLETVKEMKDI